MKEEATKEVKPEDQAVKETLEFLTQQYAAAVEMVDGQKNPQFVDFMARRLVEMAGYIIMSYLLLADTQHCDCWRTSLHVFTKYAQAEVAKHVAFIQNFQPEQLSDYLYDEPKAAEAE